MKPTGWFDQLQLTVDGYYNDVDDKIVAIPTTYVWKMYNYGEVRIWGTDVSLRSAMHWTKDWGLLIQGTYAFQDARDYTDAEAKNYRHQIPYTPKHTGNMGLRLLTPWIHVGYSVVAVGDRYCMKQNLPEYRADGYNEHAVTVSRTFHSHSATWHLQAEILNMTDTQYDIIRYYPMPGRSYRLSVRMEL
jgi:outer membrane cobalamin receptor